MTPRSGRVALFRGAHEAFSHRHVPLPHPAAGELLVRIDLCTICGSDLHTIHGRRPLAGPSVLGHEMIGQVVAVPETAVCDVDGVPVQQGDRITWSLHAACGNCFYCQHGLAQKCTQLFKYGHEPATADYPSTGGFASHCQIRRGTAIIRVPDELPDEVAAPINCATATVMAAFRQVGGCREKCVLVLGAGMLGTTAIAKSASSDAAATIVVEPNQTRCARALLFGATHVTGSLAEAQHLVQQLTQGRGADVSFDFSGHNDAVLGAIHFLRIGGIAVLVGSVFPTESITVNPEWLVRRCLRICGVHNYAVEDLRTAIAFLQATQTRYPFHELVDACYDLSQLQVAVDHASHGGAIRIGVRDTEP